MKLDLKRKAREIACLLPAVYLALKDKETPWYAKAMAALAVCYALSPVDLIPDFIPVIGYLDDLILVPLMIAATVKLTPPVVWQRSLEHSKKMMKAIPSHRWYYALPVIACYLVVLILLVKVLLF